MNHRLNLAAAILLATLSLTIADAAEPVKTPFATDAITIPALMNYQGRLTDPAGNPVNGNRDMTFKLYADSLGGTALWTETQPGVLVINGLFNVQLGSVTPISGLPEGPNCFLEVAVAGEPITPRVRITSTAYAWHAARAEDANQLGSVPASGYVRSVSAAAPLTSTGGQTPNLALNTAMGGDLAGSYPNPALTTTGVTAGTYGADTLVPQLTVDAKGRVASAANIRLGTASVPNGNIFKGTYNGTIYTVPSGKKFLLFGAVVDYGTTFLINSVGMFGGYGYASPFVSCVPPVEFPAGTVFSCSGNRGSVFGYEF